ncbi:SAF domain-containing protein [Cellulomonas phragmiteti]|uniref:SAF domain-containing protein n=1 Tax=Cellulomonas phragmiteti TaxID=478780 RepID=A0ABQ4DH73_9CELL|nr:SAF domain-containing protein [Cellulomonas phragmiteti]GIG38708.1 hypothetical protein Cph01nite_04700 [Cellulomonas phragmiteti]
MVALTPAPPHRYDAGEDPPAPLPASPGPWRTRLRGALWRLRLLLAAVCLGLAAAAVVHAVRPPAPPTVPVVVLARDVPAGTALAPGDLVVTQVPPGVAPRGALVRQDEAKGRVTATDLPAGLPLVAELLADATLAGPPGTVVVAVRLDDPAVADLLEPGLHLDLVAARLEGGPGQTVARRALVRPAPATDDAPGGLLGATSPTDGPPVLVAVTPQEAVLIAEASVSSRLVAVVVP